MTFPPNQPLDYRRPGAAYSQTDERAIFSILAFAVCAASLFLPSLILLFVIPHYKVIFLDFKVALPALTTAFLDVSAWFKSWGWIVIWSLPLLAALIAPAA